MTDLEKFMKNSITNPQPLFQDFYWHFKPIVYYVIDIKTDEIILAFLDKSILSYESLMFLVEHLNDKFKYRVISKEKYEELKNE